VDQSAKAGDRRLEGQPGTRGGEWMGGVFFFSFLRFGFEFGFGIGFGFGFSLVLVSDVDLV
jgi:hypothetical protein